jgi:predicted nucleic acid-binding protein
MTLAILPPGSQILIDANILIYGRGGLSSQCEDFLNRCGRGEFIGVISTITVAEFCHRQMLFEAQATMTLGSNPARRLAARPEVVKQLRNYSMEVQELLAAGLRILPIEAADFTEALRVQKDYGLLTNDSLLAATSVRNGIKNIATIDSDFDRISGITIYKPDDV